MLSRKQQICLLKQAFDFGIVNLRIENIMFLRSSKNGREHSSTIKKLTSKYKFSMIRTEDNGTIQPWKDSDDYELLRLNSQSKKDIAKLEETIRKGRSYRYQQDAIKISPLTKENIRVKPIRFKKSDQHSQRQKGEKPGDKSLNKAKVIASCITTPSQHHLVVSLNGKDSLAKLENGFKYTISPKKNVKGLIKRSIDLIGQTITLDVRHSERYEKQNCLRNVKEFENFRKSLEINDQRDTPFEEQRTTFMKDKQKTYTRWLQKQCEELSFLLRKRC